jgi:hypothetical protein
MAVGSNGAESEAREMISATLSIGFTGSFSETSEASNSLMRMDPDWAVASRGSFLKKRIYVIFEDIVGGFRSQVSLFKF